MEEAVRIISATVPFIKDENGKSMTTNEYVAFVARISNPKNQSNHATGAKLLKSLLRDKHWSPLEMVDITFEINTTRDIARQILRHRSFTFQEFSQRYAAVTDMSKPREARLQDTKNRQSSIEIDHYDDAQEELARKWIEAQDEVITTAQEVYDWALKKGIAKEVARSVLPEGLTMSRLYMKGSLRSWIHYCQLRMGNGTQKEHQIIASECWDLLNEEYEFLRGILDAGDN